MNLSIVAMALAGISNSKDTLWLSKCRELHSQIDDPYLRAAFSFLTCKSYKALLVCVQQNSKTLPIFYSVRVLTKKTVCGLELIQVLGSKFSSIEVFIGKAYVGKIPNANCGACVSFGM